MRDYILEEILRASTYRNNDNFPNYTTLVNFIFSHEKEYIKNVLKLKISPIFGTNYNIIVFKENFNSYDSNKN